MWNMIFLITGIFFNTLLIIVYLSKKRLNNVENKMFITLTMVNCLGLFCELFLQFVIKSTGTTSTVSIAFSKIYLAYLIGWMTIFSAYTFFINIKKEAKTRIPNSILITHTLAFVAIVFVMFIVPITIFSENDVVYSSGSSVLVVQILMIVYSFIWIITLLANIKSIRQKKYIPIIAIIILGLGFGVLQTMRPEILLVTVSHTYICFLMFHTIENPDMKLIAELEVAKDSADKANSAKTDFLSNMSHEIRTPLNAIVGFSQSLSERILEQEAREDVEDIMIASEALLEIVNGVLDISKIEANKLELVNKEYDFLEVLNELESLAKGRIGDKPIELKTSFDPSIPSVLFGDYVRIKQVIINLLTNSVKYTKQGTIDFSVGCFVKGEYCRLIISVEDSGIGIKKDSIDKLFNKFERVDLEENISIEGTGLGLAITKKLVELMHGQIVVQSKYGSGSKFTVALNQRIVKNPTNITSDEEFIDHATLEFSSKKVLVVDDNKINLKVAKRLLEQYKVQVVDVASGFECLDLINANEYFDLILLDDMMPKMTGVQTLKKLREIEGYKIPTVALTANALTGMREKYIEDGFDDYLAKPIDRNELTKIIVKYLK